MKKNILFILYILTILSLHAHESKNYEHSDFFKSMKEGDKAAILMVYFGSTHADTRSKTIEVLNAKVKQLIPNAEVREAYTSRIVIKRLRKGGIEKQNPFEALQQLHADGYTHILIQSSTIINGVEMESLIQNVTETKHLFKDVRIGTPLLYSPQDYEKTIEALTVNNDKEKAYILVGHGTYDATTAQYAMLDYMLKIKGYKNYFVGTIEGYPSFEDMLTQLKSTGLKEVVLIPFMFVAGEHAQNDIAEDWKDALEKEGYTVKVEMKGLGENTLIQDIYMSHLTFMIHHKKIDIMDKKAEFAKSSQN